MKRKPYKWEAIGKNLTIEEAMAQVTLFPSDPTDGMAAVGVYAISLSKPFAIQYPNGRSAILYVGRGRIKQRLNSHLRSWLPDLNQSFPSLRLTIHSATTEREPDDGREVAQIVEANLLNAFVRRYEGIPLFNAKLETSETVYRYRKKFLAFLERGSTPGYLWTVKPSGRNPLVVFEYTP